MTAIVMQEGTSQDQVIPKVEIRLSDEIDLPIDLMVYVNEKLEDFTRSEFMVQEFSGRPSYSLIVVTLLTVTPSEYTI